MISNVYGRLTICTNLRDTPYSFQRLGCSNSSFSSVTGVKGVSTSVFKSVTIDNSVLGKKHGGKAKINKGTDVPVIRYEDMWEWRYISTYS